jgi:phosphatidylinositol N-acetylglucosaminyltransferase subunit C
LVLIANVRPYEYRALVFDSCAICQQLAAISIFLAAFIRLYKGILDPRFLIWSSVGFVIVGYAAWILFGLYAGIKSSYDRTLAHKLMVFDSSSLISHNLDKKALKSSILVFLALMSLAPVLRTLSAATSSDSIWALSAVLFVLNVLLADYTPVNLTAQSHERCASSFITPQSDHK